MSISDTNQSKRYASIAEVAAAQCQVFTEEARKAPEYTDLAKQYAESAESSAISASASRNQAAQSANGASSSASTAQSSANEASSSAQTAVSASSSASSSALSAASSAQSASEDAQTASDAVTKTLRVSDSDISPLAAAADRANKVLSCDASGNFQFTAPASGSAQDVLNQLAEPTGAELVADGSQTVSQSLSVKFNGLSFAAGGVANSAKDLFYYAADKYWYYWNGSFPKTVASGTSPSSTGGVSSSAWLPMSDAVLKALLLSTSGSANVNRPSETVEAALSRNDAYFNDVISQDNINTIPSEDYSGYKHWTPIWSYGHNLSQYVFKTPTHVDLQFAGDPINSATGPVFSMGRDDLDQRAAFFSQDSYAIRNAMIEGGTGKLVEFEPWTAHMASVEACRIINPDEGGQWALNFKAQNWWPQVIGNTYMEYNDAGGNFVKAIDDGGNPLDRYTGNSRLLIKDNRCAWAGLSAGGIMSYTSAVGVTLRDNSAQNAITAVVFGYPSTFSMVDGLYCEMAFGNQQAIQLGDNEASDGHNIISEVQIKNVYANYHSFNTNRFIIPGNSSVLFNRLEVDRVYISNVPASEFKQPIVLVNDLQYQNIIAGRITATDTPLVQLTSNHVGIIDKYNANIPALNGDLVYIENASTAIPANTSTVVAPGWFARSTSATTFTRSGSGNPSPSLRMSRYIGSIQSSAGATTSIIYEHPRADLVNGEVVTLQALFNADSALNFFVNISVVNDNGSRTSLLSRTISGGNSWKELTFTVAISGVVTSGCFVMIEIGSVTSVPSTMYVTGHRMNRGEFGLCSSACSFSYAETQRMKSDYAYVTP